MKKLFAFILLLICVSGAKAQSVVGVKWQLMRIINLETSQEQFNYAKDTTLKARLIFKTDSTYGGYFCNTYSGKYKLVNASKMTLEKPVSTRMYCVGRMGELEKDLLSNYYPHVANFILDDQWLTLITDKVRLIYKAQ